MAVGQSFIEFTASTLTKTAPPEIWGLLLLLTFVGYMAFKRMPASVTGHIGFILVFSMSANIFGLQGGLFALLTAMLWGMSGGVFFLGLLKLIGRRV